MEGVGFEATMIRGGSPDADAAVEVVPIIEQHYVLQVEGMMCQKNCGTTVERALQAVPNVTKVIVSFPKKEAQICNISKLRIL